MSHDVFISYRRDGGEHLAGRVKDALASRGLSVFMDVEDLKSGRFDVALLREIEEATDVVVIMTPGCLDRCKNEDDWLRQEVRHAIKCGRNIVPIFERSFQMPSPTTLPSDIAELLTYNGLTPASEMFEASMDRLVSKFLKSKVRDGRSPVRKKLIWTLPILAVAAVLLFVSLRQPPKDEAVHEAVTQKLREALDSRGVRVDCTACTVQDPHVNVRVEDGNVSLTGALKNPEMDLLRSIPLRVNGAKSVEYQVAAEQAALRPNVTPPAAPPKVRMGTAEAANAGNAPGRSAAPGPSPVSVPQELSEDELRARRFVATGQEQLRLGNFISAENRFHEALNLDPQNASAKAGLAQVEKAKNDARN